jgi:NAD(P)H-hydrate epimerase
MLSEAAVVPVTELLPRMDAVLIGPGLGKSGGALAVLQAVMKHAACPTVVDADGINLLAEHKDILRGRTAPTILTPHIGEFARIGGNIAVDRKTAAAEMAKDLQAVIVLKGHGTVVTDGISCYLNPTGNPGMAVGGSGDVLAGMIAGLVGQGLTPMAAAACAAWVHGAAGDACAAAMGQYGMLPTDMLDQIPRLMK